MFSVKMIEYPFIMKIYQFPHIKPMILRKQMFGNRFCCFNNIGFAFIIFRMFLHTVLDSQYISNIDI